MNLNIDYLLHHISYELHTIVKTWTEPLCAHTKPSVVCSRKDINDEYLPFSVFAEFILNAENIHDPTDSPVIFSAGTADRQVFYAYVAAGDRYLLIGPVTFSSFVQMNLHIDLPSLEQKDLTPILCCNFYYFCSNVLLAHNLFSPSPLIRDELISSNCVKKAEEYDVMRNYSALIFERQEMDEPHNPYDQEIRESASIENGDIEMYRKSISEDYTGKLGTLSKDELRNAKNLSIVLMTLASRAAIRGGLLPEVAFSMSDIFIQKIEEMTDIVAIYTAIRQFEMEYAKLVAEIRKQDEKKSKEKQSIWVEASKEYIFKHLHEKIRVQEIADYLHLNSSYLSELFKQQESMTLTDFILQEKVKLTKNLLTYSPYSYIEIATYLGFSSQSHLGKVFKKYTDMTLRQYRERYGREQIQERRKAELISNE